MEKRIAVITGAGNGIGLAILRRLIEDGYEAVAVDIDAKAGKKLLASFGKKDLHFAKADIGKEKTVKALFREIVKRYGRVDALINNAGIIRDNMIWKMTAEEFDAVLDINLRGTWLMCREAASVMREQQSGRIVNIASRAWLGNAGQSNYSASKAGVVALTRVLALELGKNGVLVNAVAPGLIDTPLSKKLKPEVREKLIQAQPTRSMGNPEDVAQAVSFLLHEQTRFITGQTLYVDGGKSIGAGI
ncbi:MAG: SDR family oxidoreductase [Bacteroidia bacterium]|nr:SDR family oxidoreductase [Bacteroidia bacterium]